MKKTIVILIALALLLGWAVHATGDTKYTAPTIATSTPPAPKLTTRQTIWLNALEWCESRGVDTAINPKDRDNTPSYGLLQFKPSTYAIYAKLLGMASTTDYMNPKGQVEIVTAMILDPNTKWLQQFPDCVYNKIGFPPKN